jgi:hypothetical protein
MRFWSEHPAFAGDALVLTERESPSTGSRHCISRGSNPRKSSKPIHFYQHLTLSQIYTALAYFHANRDEIERELASTDADYEQLKQELVS